MRGWSNVRSGKALVSLVVVGLALAVAACGGSDGASSGSGAASGGSLAKVRLRLPWTMTGYMDPLVYAKQKGFYAKAGLDVDIEEGKGSVTTGQTVANGADQFGFVDASAIAPLISKGAPLKVIAVYQQKTGVSFVHRPDLTLTSARDLVGHPVVHTANDNGTQLLPAVLAKAGVQPSQLKSDVVQPTSLGQAFLATKDSVMVGSINSTFQALKATQPDLQATLYPQLGVNVLSFGLVTSDDMITQHPDQVRAMVKAVSQGWTAAQQDPKAASEAAAQAFPNVKPDIELAQLQETLKLLHTPASEGHPLGWMAEKDWRQTIDLMHRYGGLNPVKPLSDYYTNEFLPSS